MKANAVQWPLVQVMRSRAVFSNCPVQPPFFTRNSATGNREKRLVSSPSAGRRPAGGEAHGLLRADNEALLTVQAPREDREQQLERAGADREPEPISRAASPAVCRSSRGTLRPPPRRQLD